MHWLGLVTPSALFPLRDPVPVEHQVPVEATDGEVRRLLVGQSVVVDDVNDGADYIGRVPGYPIQQRLEPALTILTLVTFVPLMC